MLSDNIRALSDDLRRHRKHGCVLEPAGVEVICAILDACALDAEALEASPAIPAGFADPKVIHLFPAGPRR